VIHRQGKTGRRIDRERIMGEPGCDIAPLPVLATADALPGLGRIDVSRSSALLALPN
jgi:hypothetical protein